MTKFNFMSDLHLEMAKLVLPGGETLLLAGDIAVAGLYDDGHPIYQERFVDFFSKECAKYDRVLYIAGNHEYYHSSWQQAPVIMKDRLQKCGAKNVQFLQDEFVQVGDVFVYASTLWTDFNNNDPMTKHMIANGMNDYHVVSFNAAYENMLDVPAEDQFLYNRNRKLRPDDTYASHVKTVSKMYDFLDAHKTDKVLIMTHHAPHPMSIGDDFESDPMNGGYVSDLSELILDNPQIKAWVHGHIHQPRNYMIGNTQVISNPRGYANRERYNHLFQPDASISI